MLGRRIAALQLPPTCPPELGRALLDEWCTIPQDQIAEHKITSCECIHLHMSEKSKEGYQPRVDSTAVSPQDVRAEFIVNFKRQKNIWG
ncbi:hypothetical protein TNCV_274411 [Trichonephila clavipes]|nr:hypothetical protein TNCV_274411 [Trichonephila clavipes]